MASGHVGGGSAWKRGERSDMIKHVSGARAGYKIGTNWLGQEQANGFGFGPLVFF